MARRRYMWIEDRGHNRLPFSKVILAGSLMVVGVAPETAYSIAGDIEGRLDAMGHDTYSSDLLVEYAVESLVATVGVGVAERFRTWVVARRRQRPLLVLLGGGTGVGKSTIASEVASRLTLSPVVPTDAVREVMRFVLPGGVVPSLHLSSFEAHRALQAPLPEDHDPVVVAFRQQAEIVGAGVRGLVNRAVREATNLMVEGAHVLPGMFDDDLPTWRKRAVVCQVVLSVTDAEEHRAHFLTRLERSPAREPQRYLDQFAEIRRIQRYIVRLAHHTGVPVVEMGRLDETIQAVLSQIVEAVINEAADA